MRFLNQRSFGDLIPLLDLVYGQTQSHGRNPGFPGEEISVMEALKVYTIHSALACRGEYVKGSIEMDKVADFDLLDRVPFAIDEDELIHVGVDMTNVDGKIAYEKNGG